MYAVSPRSGSDLHRCHSCQKARNKGRSRSSRYRFFSSSHSLRRADVDDREYFGLGCQRPHSVVLPGIGRLVRVDRNARMGRNPATGEAIKIAAKKVVKFRIAKAAKDAIVPPKKAKA